MLIFCTQESLVWHFKLAFGFLYLNDVNLQGNHWTKPSVLGNDRCLPANRTFFFIQFTETIKKSSALYIYLFYTPFCSLIGTLIRFTEIGLPWLQVKWEFFGVFTDLCFWKYNEDVPVCCVFLPNDSIICLIEIIPQPFYAFCVLLVHSKRNNSECTDLKLSVMVVSLT